MDNSYAPSSARAGAVTRLRAVSILETISFVGLLIMMFSHNEGGVSILGMIHGLLFLAYAIIVFRDRELLGWTMSFVAIAILTGPIGAIVVLERLRRGPGHRA